MIDLKYVSKSTKYIYFLFQLFWNDVCLEGNLIFYFVESIDKIIFREL